MICNFTYSCGHEGTEEFTCTVKQRENKIEWYETKGLCRDCYIAKKTAENREKGLIWHVGVSKVPERGFVHIYAAFSGDSYAHKDEIKALGYRFGELPGSVKMYVPAYYEKKGWYKEFDAVDLESEIKAVEGISAKIERGRSDKEFDRELERAKKQLQREIEAGYHKKKV